MTATRCNTLKHTHTLQHTATHCITLHHTATHCNTLQHTAIYYSTLQHTAAHCITLQHTAAHCNTPRHPATPCSALSAVGGAGILQQFRSRYSTRTHHFEQFSSTSAAARATAAQNLVFNRRPLSQRFAARYTCTAVAGNAAQMHGRLWNARKNALQCVAVCCSVLHCGVVCCTVLHCVALCCSVLQCAALCCSVV